MAETELERLYRELAELERQRQVAEIAGFDDAVSLIDGGIAVLNARIAVLESQEDT
jgi:uncharacterized protein (DUF488 family)